ncbi:hypothetical protein PANO111632_13940 [Paracoccus nototheniae]
MSAQKTFEARSLCEHENYMMTLHESPGNTDNRLLITFGPANSDFSTSGFATAVAKKLGIDSIYVAQRLGTYYQGLPLEDFLGVVAPLLPGRDVITYGGSLGAWCAFYYGGPINARIIAFSPLNPGHPDYKTNGFAVPLLDYAHGDLRSAAISTHCPILAIDPYRQGDVDFTEQFIAPAYQNVIRYEVPYAGHNILDRMRRAGTLKSFVTDALAGQVPEKIVIKEEGCPHWHFERARLFRWKKDNDAAEVEYRAALKAEFNRVTVTNLVSFLLQVRTDADLRAAIAEIGPAQVLSMLPARVADPLIKAGYLQPA